MAKQQKNVEVENKGDVNRKRGAKKQPLQIVEHNALQTMFYLLSACFRTYCKDMNINYINVINFHLILFVSLIYVRIFVST
jgi:hypothetical protein